jgi:uncharacterized protein
MELQQYELVLLRRPAAPTEYDDATLGRLQAQHLAFYDRLRASGEVVTNGPVIRQPDPSLRGLAFYRVGSVEAALVLAEQDPLVLAGRLVLDVMQWWCRPGTMSRPGTLIDIDD